MIHNLVLPLDNNQISQLKCGDLVNLNGIIFTARDAAHARLVKSINEGSPIPINLCDAAIYYCGPTPAREGEAIGSCGPTTSGRMDDFTPTLMAHGLKITIGKGDRSNAVIEAIKQHKGIYLSAVGGAAALMKSCVRRCDCIAYDDLGCEAIYRLQVENMPLIVWIDSLGNILGK